MKTRTSTESIQKKFDFAAPRPRPFLANLPARIDTYEEGVARFFHRRTGLDYYATIDQIVDFIINTGRTKVVDLVSDTATFALRLAGRKAFQGRVLSFDDNITLLERARQRAKHLNLESSVEFRRFDGMPWPVPDSSAEIVVSIFDFHRHPGPQLLREARRILARDGYLLLGEVLEPKTRWNKAAWFFRKLQLRYVLQNPAEAAAVFYDHEEMIRMVFAAGFRQIVIQGLQSRSSPHAGTFSLIAATK